VVTNSHDQETDQKMKNTTKSRPDLEGMQEGTSMLEALVSRAGNHGKSLPPVDKWHPDFCGDIDMVIKRDGTWFYMGTPIGRAPLVRLFSTVLRKDDDGKTYLVTPVEKIGIIVEDAHFVAVEMSRQGEGHDQVLTFRTNVGDVVEVSDENPLRFEIVEENQGVKPYLRVRGRLDALVSRAVMYDLIELGEEIEVNGASVFALRSNGAVFPIMKSDDLSQSIASDDH
jgi:hypothetical protein